MSENQYKLIVSKGPNPGQSYPLLANTITIGRDPMSDIVFNDPEVSRQHVRFTRLETGYQIQDLGSTNGTFLNGQRLEADPVELDDETEIALGSGITLLYQINSLEPEKATMDATMIDNDPLLPDFEFPETADIVDTGLPPATDFLDSSYQPAPSAPAPTPAASAQIPLVPSSPGAPDKKRRNTIIVVSIILLLCCCCVLFLVSGYYWWGDLLLEWLGLI